ncbi:MAG: 4'-phosphopantetheinyl transferase family protein, partial [Limisphaerales bacterium]
MSTADLYSLMTDLMPNLELLWPDPSKKWQVRGPEVHVWAVDLNQSIGYISFFEESLAPDELDRASKFYFERDRLRFIAGKGILRQILSSYLEIEPSQLHFRYGSHGKPYLIGTQAVSSLHFNVTHAEDLLLVSVTRACAVGIDVEQVRPIPELEHIVHRYFLTRESAGLLALPPQQQPRACFQLWTRKEARLKATG